MAAAHIEVAKREGAKAGFKMWKKNLKRSGIPQVQDRLAELEAQGDIEAQYKYYCAEYGDKIGLKQPTSRTSKGRTSKPATEPTTPTAGELFAQFRAFLAATQGATAVTEDEDEVEEYEDDEFAVLDDLDEPQTTPATAAKPATRRAAAPAQDPFAPREPNAHATNGRLWKLNELGLLRITKKPGDAITNGEAHSILKNVLAD